MESKEKGNIQDKNKRFNETIVEDIRLIDQVSATLSKKIKKAVEVPQRTLDYYSTLIDWCSNLKGDILSQAGIFSEKVTTEEIINLELKPDQKANIVLLRAGNPFYKRVLAEYAKNKIENLLDLLDQELVDLSEEEKELYLYFDTSDIEINGRKINPIEDRVKEIVKEKIKSSEGKIRIPLSDRSRYNSIDEYIDDYIRVLSASTNKLRAKRIPMDIYENVQQLSQKVQLLKNRGILSEEENTYYHGVLYRLGEYYVSVAEGQQISVEEGLKGIKIDRDLFMINQCIAEAVYEIYKYPKEDQEDKKQKLYIKK